MADSRLGVAPQPAMQPDKHKEGGEADQSKGEDMSSANPPASSASSASSTTTSSSSSSSTTTTTTTTSSPSSSSTSSSTTSSTTRGTHSVSDVSSTCSSSSSSSNIDSNSVSSNNRVSSAIGVGSSSVGSSLSNPGMGNPFARAAIHASWGSTDSCEQRPILAPSRLSSHTDSGPKVTSSGGLRPPSLGASGRLGGPLRPAAGTSFFPPPTLTVTGSSPPQAAKSEFKLKPSVLGSPNPFAKPVPESPGEKAEGEREGSSRVLSSNHQQEEATTPVTGSHCQVSSSTPAATTTSPKEEAQGARTPTQTTDSKSTSRSPPKSNSNTPGNNNITTTTTTIGTRSLFLPLSRSNSNSDSTSSPTLGNSSFIFGQNLHSKVTSGGAVTSSGGNSGGGGGGGGGGGSGGWGLATDAAAPTTNGEKPTGNLFSEAASEVSRWSEGAAGGGGGAAGATLAAAAAAAATAGATTNGQPHTGNLFSEAASEISRPGDEHQAWGSGQSLAESSRELTEKEKSQKRKFDEVEVITGEENESNVLQMNCKLYAWVSGWWQERGRGILRLNDWDAGGQQSGTEAAGGGGGSSKEIRSRLVIRTQGTLTVMLNTKVWAEMSVERASSKSVRFTALDADGQPKIFLAMGSPKDVDLLHNSLEWRVAASRAHTQEETAAESTKKAKADDNTSSAVPL